MTSHILVIAEKPSVAQSIAAVLGAKEKKKRTALSRGTATLFHGVSDTLSGLRKLPPMGNSTRNGAMTAYPFCRRNGNTPLLPIRKRSLTPSKTLCTGTTFPKSSMPATQDARGNSFSVLSMKLPGVKSPCAAFGFPQWRTKLSGTASPI